MANEFDTAEELRLTGYSRPASQVVSVQEQKFSDYSLPAARLSIAAEKGDKETPKTSEPLRFQSGSNEAFLEEMTQQNRIRRQMGGFGTGSYGPDMEYLNSPTLRQRYEMDNARESTNVEDRRGEEWRPFTPPPGTIVETGPNMFNQLVGGTTPQQQRMLYDKAIEMGRGFMEDVNRTLQDLVNPTSGVTAESGTEERYAQELLAQRAQGRAAARVGMDLATAGMSRAVGASEAAVGAFGGRLPNRAQVREGMEARAVYDDATKAEFRIGTPEGKKVGEYTVMEGSVPNTLSIENIVVNKEFQRQGVARDVYAQLRAQAGDREVIPSGSLQEGTYKLWKEMNPKLLEAGKYKKLKDGSYERTDDNFTSYFTAAGATVASAGAAQAQGYKPSWVEKDGSIDREKLRKDLVPEVRSWIDRPVPLPSGGELTYPAPTNWKDLEAQTKMSKKELRAYIEQVFSEKVHKDERANALRHVDELFSEDGLQKYGGWGVGETWSYIHDMMRH